MIGKIEGGVSPLKIFGKRRKGGTKVKRKATKTKSRRGGFSKSTKSKNIPGFNKATRYKYIPRPTSSSPKSPEKPVVTTTGAGGQPIVNIDISDLIDMNIANALGGGPVSTEEVLDETTTTTTVEESKVKTHAEFADKHGRLPEYKEVWELNLDYKGRGKIRDRFDTYEEYVIEAEKTGPPSGFVKRSKGSYKEKKASSTTTTNKRTKTLGTTPNGNSVIIGDQTITNEPQ